MYYIVTVTRGGRFWAVTSPSYGVFALAPAPARGTYLWGTEADARADQRWQELLRPGDQVAYHRTYQG